MKGWTFKQPCCSDRLKWKKLNDNKLNETHLMDFQLYIFCTIYYTKHCKQQCNFHFSMRAASPFTILFLYSSLRTWNWKSFTDFTWGQAIIQLEISFETWDFQCLEVAEVEFTQYISLFNKTHTGSSCHFRLLFLQSLWLPQSSLLHW